MKKFVWLTVDWEARSISAKSFEEAVSKVIQYRMNLGESLEDAKEHHARNDQIYEIIEEIA
jgi:hypothetical protein